MASANEALRTLSVPALSALDCSEGPRRGERQQPEPVGGGQGKGRRDNGGVSVWGGGGGCLFLLLSK